ncbi:uncharacterized protein [Ptychodera flava]|uniref:uncharacterized protein n=1 Tax=Ptychodera flava TaxID=63121 RepID=UPI003969ED22
MDADKEQSAQLFQAVTNLRNLIEQESLVLLIGEGASILPQPASIDDWWKIFPDLDDERVPERLARMETEYVRQQPQGQSRFHNVLRTLGKFPLIITTNLDELLERLLWNSGIHGDRLYLNQVSKLKKYWPNYHRDVVVKCFGDSSFQTRVGNSHRSYFEETCDQRKDENTDFLQQIFDENSVLFLGCNVDHAIYKKFLNKFAAHSKANHYIFESVEEGGRSFSQNGKLSILKADLELWEFVQHLSSGKGIQTIQDIHPGKVYEISFLPTQRESYLRQQLLLEENATEIAFHTTSITNALTTNELLEQVSRPSLINIYRKDPFGSYSEEEMKRALKAMYDRRDNLIKSIHSGVKVIAIFLYENVLAEIDPSLQTDKEKRAMSLRKYAKSILLCNTLLKTKSSLELLMVEGGDTESTKSRRLKKETFAIIKLKGGVDEAICYAETATAGKKNVTTHLVVVNGEEVARRRKIFDTSRECAWDCDRTVLKLTAAVLQHNKGINAIDSEDLRRLNSLHDVHLIVDQDNVVPSKLEPLGKGQFGEVYKVVDKKGNTYALKVLKEMDEADFTQLVDFRREVETLRKASHPNIIKLDDVERQGNRLCLKLEFVDGCDLRKVIEPKDGRPRPQSKEFTLRCATQIGDALSHLHKLGIVHRDVKAENVLITKDQKTFKLGDFGLARTTRGTLSKKTLVGSMRYMAPEVKQSGNYSVTADVFSYGLMLLEVINGDYVFSNILDDEIVYDQKESLVPPIPDTCESVHGYRMKVVLTMCLKITRNRPKMDQILHELTITDEHQVTSHSTFSHEIELLCLGTGKGTTAALFGEPSSSLVILVRGKPVLLVDLGLGVLKSYREHIGDTLPLKLFITHNHLDHSGELALGLFLAAEKMKQLQNTAKMSVFAGPEVVPRLRDHRLHEIYSAMPREKLDPLLEWIDCKEKETVFLDQSKELFIKAFKSQHKETCYGFVLYYKDVPILGYTADSGYNQEFYDEIFVATTVVVDARIKGNTEHASFVELLNYLDKVKIDTRVLVIGYGTAEDWPNTQDMPRLNQMHRGMTYTLWPVEEVLETSPGKLQHKYKALEKAV